LQLIEPEEMYYEASVKGRFFLSPAFQIRTQSFSHIHQIKNQSCPDLDINSRYAGPQNGANNCSYYNLGYEDIDCGDVTVEIILDGTPRNRSNEFMGGINKVESGIRDYARVQNGSLYNGTEKEYATAEDWFKERKFTPQYYLFSGKNQGDNREVTKGDPKEILGSGRIYVDEDT
jgi:hypothetical protein